MIYSLHDYHRACESVFQEGIVMSRADELIEKRNRIIQTINMEFDILIQQAMAEEGTARSAAPAEYDATYPLTAGTALFKGRKPTGITLENGTREYARTWKRIAEIMLKDCIKDRNRRVALEGLRNKVGGKSRVFLSDSGENMTSPIEIAPRLYFESNYDTETLLRILMIRIFDVVGYDYGKIKISLQN